ncbi:hypothetical protein [Pararhizobium gei]|uniref:hypothetical protein n=1 Tax=Pararhizobium gei TaxID=1395951 RepID=UPI0023DBAFE2|nr:hypothetical protein [Rhizobium gei]
MALTTPIIHCLFDAEPESFHSVDPSLKRLAVNLGFECQTDITLADIRAGETAAAKRGELAKDEDAAKSLFKTFAGAVQAVRFAIFEVKPEGETRSVTAVDTAAAIARQISDAPAPDAAEHVSRWLDMAAPADPGIRHYWATPATSLTETSIEATVAPATYRLRAAHSWNAPVSHRLGLTHILEVAGTEPSHSYAILPVFGDPATVLFPENRTSDGAFCDFTYDPGGGVGEIICRTEILPAPGAFTLSPETVSPFLDAQGYLKVDAQAEAFWRSMTWFEARAASLMSPVAVLAGPGAGTNSWGDEAYDALFSWSEALDGDVLDAPAAAWLAVTGLCAALDMLAIGTMKPVSETATMGEVLAPLVLALADALPARLGIDYSLADKDNEISILAGMLRGAISAQNAVFQRQDMSDAANRERLCRNLRHLHGIPSKPNASLETELLNTLLDSFQHGIPTRLSPPLASALTEKGAGASILRKALADVEQRLQDETGAETTILRLFETEATADAGSRETAIAGLFASLYAGHVGRTGDAPLAAAVELAFLQALKSYRTLLDTAFNGAEAIRRAASSEFTKALLSVATQAGQLVEAVRQSDYYGERLLGPAEGAPSIFAGIITRLVAIPLPVTVDGEKLTDFMRDGYQAAVAEIDDLVHGGVRFVPDSAPAPLPIQIAANIDGQDMERFARAFNGIGIAIRRMDAEAGAAADGWAHASLADLAWPASSPPKAQQRTSAAIHPLLPGTSDGRGPMFIEYEGLPLAAETFAQTAAEAVAATPAAQTPFYAHETHDPSALPLPGFAKVPRLAYGRTFQTFSFATTNAGTLPYDLQDDDLQDGLPWMPKPSFGAPALDGKPDPRLVLTTRYQRRTAIGQIAMTEPGSQPRRIAEPLPGVLPLCDDYPRTVLAAEGHPGVCDLFRNRDGRGSISVSSGPGVVLDWKLADVTFTGKPLCLVARLFNAAPSGPVDTGVGKIRLKCPSGFDFTAVKEISFRLESRETATGQIVRLFSFICGELTGTFQLAQGTEISEGWIRLALEADAASTLGFATADDLKPYEPAAPLLLLAPDDTVWKAGLSSTVDVQIDTPRIGYLDFDRWFSNGSLLKRSFPGKKDTLDETAANNLKRALLTAYVLRDTDENLPRFLDRLPDPAVEAIQIQLAIQNQLAGPSTAQHSAFNTISLSGKLLDIAKSIPAGVIWTPDLLKTHVFQKIETAFRITLSVKPGPFGMFDDGVTVQVPAGTVARLSVDALVPGRHFQPDGHHPPVLHEGLRQHAGRVIPIKGETAQGFMAYACTAMRIETMFDGMPELAPDATGEATKPAIALAERMIKVRPIAQSRRYDILTAKGKNELNTDSLRRQWQLLGEIGITTQRWRPSGRPIYNHIAPAEAHDIAALSDLSADEAAHAAVPVRADDDVLHFEREAFFDRPDIDAQTVTQRLAPMPARTVLEQHNWDAPSATYFRHRFTLRSRYAGALASASRREVKAWVTDARQRTLPSQAWTLRVAMLAELSRLVLTRPQQRALIPLTAAAISNDATPAAPPVLSILQEPPFSRGGLADRIAAEIKTGFSYGFASGDADATLEILDSRKEIGPDPRLSYRPMPADVALEMALNAEGPAGLTFDAPNAPGAAFPNSLLWLSPVSLTGRTLDLEEHFLGVSMRRYIDPNWTVPQPVSDPARLDGERCWWIERRMAGAKDGKQVMLSYGSGEAATELLTLESTGDTHTVTILKEAVDGIAGASEKVAAVTRWSGDQVRSLIILHQPTTPGRYCLSVLARPIGKPNVAQGNSNTPLLMCSADWSPARGSPVTLDAKGATALSALVSAPTFLAWTRTARNFDLVHTPDAGSTPDAPVKIPVRDLFGQLDAPSNTLTFDRSNVARRTWICSSTFQKPVPLHVHRHLAVLTTGFLDSPGRPLEQYRRAALLTGRTVTLPHSDGTADTAENCLRIVEFETPAAILCGSDLPVPDVYKRAYFDLVSTGFAPGEDGAACARLLVRFAGPPAHVARFASLAISLCFSENGSEKHVIPVDLKAAGATQHVVAIELLLERPSGNDLIAYRPVLVLSDGESRVLDPVPASNALGLRAAGNSHPGFFLDILASGGSGEFWADVSFLHAPRPNLDNSFDFNWLFSSASGSPPALDVSPSGLNRMVEAQARIVAVSPPVPIHPKT